MGVLEQIGAYLEAQSVGTVGTDIFYGRMPDTPDNAIALYEYVGEAPEFAHDSTTPITERPRVQTAVRNSDYSAGNAKIQAVYDQLRAVANQELSGKRYYRIIPLQTPFYLRRDANERVEFVANYRILKAAE